MGGTRRAGPTAGRCVIEAILIRLYERNDARCYLDTRMAVSPAFALMRLTWWSRYKGFGLTRLWSVEKEAQISAALSLGTAVGKDTGLERHSWWLPWMAMRWNAGLVTLVAGGCAKLAAWPTSANAVVKNKRQLISAHSAQAAAEGCRDGSIRILLGCCVPATRPRLSA